MRITLVQLALVFSILPVTGQGVAAQEYECPLTNKAVQTILSDLSAFLEKDPAANWLRDEKQVTNLSRQLQRLAKDADTMEWYPNPEGCRWQLIDGFYSEYLAGSENLLQCEKTRCPGKSDMLRATGISKRLLAREYRKCLAWHDNNFTGKHTILGSYYCK